MGRLVVLFTEAGPFFFLQFGRPHTDIKVTLGALSLTLSSVTAIDFGTANNNTILFTQGTSAIGLTGSTVLDVYHYVAGDNLAFSGSATPNSNDIFTNVQFFSGAVG